MTPVWSCYFETKDGSAIKNVEAETVDEAYAAFLKWAKVKPSEITEIDMVMIVDEEGTPVYNDLSDDKEAE